MKPIKLPNRNPINMKPIRMDPINRDILRALESTRVKVTPSQVAKAIGIHPATAQSRIKGLSQRDLVRCTPKGNRNYCKINLPQVRKALKKGFL